MASLRVDVSRPLRAPFLGPRLPGLGGGAQRPRELRRRGAAERPELLGAAERLASHGAGSTSPGPRWEGLSVGLCELALRPRDK